MNERHERQLKLAHQLYDNRDLKQELLWQREFLDTGYLNYQQCCFNKWIFDECLKRFEKLGKIEEIVNCELIAGRRNFKSCYDAFFEIVDVIQDRGVLENE